MNKLFLPIVIFTILFSSATLSSIPFAFADIVLGPGENVFSIDSFSATLHKINPDTGAIIDSVEITLEGAVINGGAGLVLNQDDGKLWALLKQEKGEDDLSDRILVTLDPRTGIATKIGDSPGKFAALAFNPGTLFSATTAQAGLGSPPTEPSTLYTLSTQDASDTEICELANGLSEDGRALAFRSADGSLYHAFRDTLEKIGDTSGATCVVTDIPLSGDSFGAPTGLVFREATHEFLVARGGDRDLYTISANPGVVTFVGDMSHQSRGLAIIGPPVGGELLPINTTALLIAGLQSSVIWILPVLAVAAGAGAYFVRTRQNKD